MLNINMGLGKPEGLSPVQYNYNRKTTLQIGEGERQNMMLIKYSTRQGKDNKSVMTTFNVESIEDKVPQTLREQKIDTFYLIVLLAKHS